MKKYLFILMAAGCLAVACEKKGEVLSPDDQKSVIEETAVQAVEAVDLDNWKGTADMIVTSAGVVASSTPDDGMQDWIESLNDIFVLSNTGKDYEVMEVDLTKITGEFSVLDDGKIVRTNTRSGLSLGYYLPDDTFCKATATIKNSSTKILIDENYDREYDGSGNVTKETLMGQQWLIVPSFVDVKLTAAGKTEVRAKFTTDFEIAGNEPRPTDKLSATADISFGGYNLYISRAKYSDTNVELKANFKKGKTSILSATFSAKGKLAFEEDDDLDIMSTDGKVNVTASLMETVDLKGTLDWTAYKRAQNSMDPTTAPTEEGFKARLGFEPVVENNNFDLYTVIRFEDGSAYQMAEEFFNPADYGRVLEAVSSLLAKVTEYIDGIEIVD